MDNNLKKGWKPLIYTNDENLGYLNQYIIVFS